MAGTPATARSLNQATLVVLSDGSLGYTGDRGTIVRLANAPVNTGPWANVPARTDHDWSRYFVLEDDMMQQGSATTDLGTTWTDMKSTGGTNAFQNVPGGVYNMVTSTTNDDWRGIRTTAQNWKFVAGKEHWMEAAFTINEGQTNLTSWIVGWTDTFTTGGLQAGNAGPLASFSGALIFKNGGAMAAKLMTSNGASQNTSATIATVVTNQKIKVGMYFDSAATTSNVFPFVDIGDGNGWVAGASQTLTLSGLNAMSFVATVKCGGSGTTAETMQLDYIKVYALR